MKTKRLKYEYRVNADSARERVVRMVGRDKRVLELGPGPGMITRKLIGESHCRITALEIDADAISNLAHFCEQVHRADLNDSGWVGLVENAGGRRRGRNGCAGVPVRAA